MSFLNLWSALAIGAAVVSLLVLLYFLKLRRREQTVSSTLLWRRAVQDLQVNAPFQRLRRNLLLLLQLLVLAAGVLALARPVVQTPLARQKSLVLILDRSASMNVIEDDEVLRQQVREEEVVRPGGDGNAVSLEREMAKIGANRLRYETIGRIVRQQLGLLRYAAQEGDR